MPKRAGEAWTDKESQQIQEAFGAGQSFEEIAEKHQRTSGATLPFQGVMGVWGSWTQGDALGYVRFALRAIVLRIENCSIPMGLLGIGSVGQIAISPSGPFGDAQGRPLASSPLQRRSFIGHLQASPEGATRRG